MLKYVISYGIVLGLVSGAFCQEPWDVAKTMINGKKVSIEYGRPILKGRTLAGLMKQLPPDRIWRAGAGPATILSAGTDLLIGGKKVTAGNYALYMYCPVEGDYALIVNSEIGQPNDAPLAPATSNRSNRPYPAFVGYTETVGSKEIVRVPLKKASVPKTEILIYNFESSDKGATLTISWGDQSWTVDFQPAG